MNSDWLLVLLLLLPVAALSGWYLARRSMARDSASTAMAIPPEYLKGLNYVLNEQQDKAIELFIKMLEVDSDTVETHLALGNLFRRRGEVDRAIRIHQNLIARPTLSGEQRHLALLELGMDYMRSGLLDRAEGLFKELVDNHVYGVQAYSGLLDIYQQEKDWHAAITTARHLQTITRDSREAMIAQFFCELAEEKLNQGYEKEAKENARRALNNDPTCVRASLLEAEIAMRSGKYKAALKSYKRIEKQDPDYLSEIIKPMLNCYRALGRLDDYMKYLQELIERYHGITPLLSLTELVEETQGEEAAIQFISTELKKRPTVRGVHKLIEYVLTGAEGRVKENLQTIKHMTERLIKNSAIYKCNHCGFEAKLMHWQCPSCKYWNTIKPVHGVEGE